MPAINEDLVKELAKRKPLRAVFRDAGFGSDSVKINVEQIFKLLSPATEVKSHLRGRDEAQIQDTGLPDRAVEAVVDCFAGQPHARGISYRIDPGSGKAAAPSRSAWRSDGFKNADLALSDAAAAGQHPGRPAAPEPAAVRRSW